MVVWCFQKKVLDFFFKEVTELRCKVIFTNKMAFPDKTYKIRIKHLHTPKIFSISFLNFQFDEFTAKKINCTLIKRITI